MSGPLLRFLVSAAAAATAALAAVTTAPPFSSPTSAALSVWPPPRRSSSSGPARRLGASFKLTVEPENSQLGDVFAEGLRRFSGLLNVSRSRGAVRRDGDGLPLLELRLYVQDLASEHLGSTTDDSYEVHVHAQETTGNITARTVFGALYALETFVQLVGVDGRLAASAVAIQDSADYAWRGVMIDSGRRFFPVPLVKNLLDTMAAVKLNVLHLHASDHCRFAVESKRFPALTASLTGDMAGFYTQADIRELVVYARRRGIRIVPEFDVPGHAKGMQPLEAEGLQFCTNGPNRTQIFGDPEGASLRVLTELFQEMAGLFDDEVFHIGCDETQDLGKCTTESTRHLETGVQEIVKGLGKTVEGWEELMFPKGVARKNATINTWRDHGAGQVTDTGRRAVESDSAHFYFTEPAPGGPEGWARCHYDISASVPQSQRSLLLGGEMSMWSDHYCPTLQCGAAAGPPEVGAHLFPPSADEAFAQSIGGMVWPRGFVAAQSFWHYDASRNASSAEFVQAVYKRNDELQARGSLVCPSGCSCDLVSACGKPYLPSRGLQGLRGWLRVSRTDSRDFGSASLLILLGLTFLAAVFLLFAARAHYYARTATSLLSGSSVNGAKRALSVSFPSREVSLSKG